MTDVSWASIEDVLTYTGAAVSTSVLMQAQALVDVHARRSYFDADRVGDRDKYWLKLTVCYQATWIDANPDLYQRMNITALGQNRSITQFGPDALTLGPVAKRALKNVSWMRSRSLHAQSPFTDGIGVMGIDPLSSAADDLYPWTSIE